MRSGRLFERRTLVPPIDAHGCSSWPTPRTITGGAESAERKQELGRTQSGGGDLQAKAQEWPTPNATLTQDREDPATWRARQAELVEKGYNGNGAGVPLTIKAMEWPTASGRDWKGPSGQGFLDRRVGTPDLAARANEWTTPTVGDSKAAGSRNTEGSRAHMGTSLTDQVRGDGGRGRPDPRETGPGSPSGSTRRLNPAFVEWLMGFPPFWTLPRSRASIVSDALATPSSPPKRPLRSES